MWSTDGLISAKRLLPVVRALVYQGSARNLRRAVAEVEGAVAAAAPVKRVSYR